MANDDHTDLPAIDSDGVHTESEAAARESAQRIVDRAMLGFLSISHSANLLRDSGQLDDKEEVGGVLHLISGEAERCYALLDMPGGLMGRTPAPPSRRAALPESDNETLVQALATHVYNALRVVDNHRLVKATAEKLAGLVRLARMLEAQLTVVADGLPQ